MKQVELKNIVKRYKDVEIIKNLNLDIDKGEFVVIVGPSGCGKSTVLRMIAGFEEITGGTISITNNIVNEMEPKDRNVAMVFQNYALYPHLSVEENITLGLTVQKMDKNLIEQKLSWAADVLGLKEYLNRKPKDLSGGQRQRVALGRAMVRDPAVFLMDEPLSNLDAKLRVKMRNEITKLHRELAATTIYVTHDQVEAMTMADKIVVMKDGVMNQVGTPLELYKKPNNAFVASFIGTPQMNIIEVECQDKTIVLSDGTKIELPEGVFKSNNFNDGKLLFGIRPEHISLAQVALETYKGATLKVTVDTVERMGDETIIYAKHFNNNFVIKIAENDDVNIGSEIDVAINMNKAHFFDIESQESLRGKLKGY